MRDFAFHRIPALAFVLVAVGAAVACSDDDPATPPTNTADAGNGDGGGDNADAGNPDDIKPEPCTNELSFAPGQEQQLQDAVNSLTGCATITLAAGTYTFDNAITIRQNNVTFKGAGRGVQGEATGGAASTVLDFTTAATNTNGVDVVGKWFTVSDLAIWNAKKDALRVESSRNVKIQKIRTEWASADLATNGAYGVYPVKSANVLVEECEAYNAADAGIYVGQTTHAIVRRNTAKQNVAGIEIENTQYADVYENIAEDNTGGLVVFDLPGNPVAGTDVRLYRNIVKNNNRNNFATGGSTVAQIPAGTGTFVMASRRVEFFENQYENNNSVDIALISGLSLEGDTSKWTIGNFGDKDIYIHDNTFAAGSGDSVDNGTPSASRELGQLIYFLYQYGATQGVTRTEPVLWDGVDATGEDNLTNDINLCVKTNTYPDGTAFAVADLNFPAVGPLAQSARFVDAWAKTARYAANAAPFDCAGLSPAIAEVTLP